MISLEYTAGMTVGDALRLSRIERSSPSSPRGRSRSASTARSLPRPGCFGQATGSRSIVSSSMIRARPAGDAPRSSPACAGRASPGRAAAPRAQAAARPCRRRRASVGFAISSSVRSTSGRPVSIPRFGSGESSRSTRETLSSSKYTTKCARSRFAITPALERVDVIPALRREGIRDHRRAEQVADLAARHAAGDLVHVGGFQIVALLDVRPVHAASHGGRDQQQGGDSGAREFVARILAIHLSGVAGVGR